MYESARCQGDDLFIFRPCLLLAVANTAEWSSVFGAGLLMRSLSSLIALACYFVMSHVFAVAFGMSMYCPAPVFTPRPLVRWSDVSRV
jgi:hypothetical protein